MKPQSELERVKTEYANRKTRLAHSNIYSPLNTAYLFTIQQRQRAETDLLRHMGLTDLSNCRLLEIGCGHGDVLHDYLFHRFPANHLHGAELREDSLIEAKKRFPGIGFAQVDGQHLPYANESFDLVLQYMMFSSILDKSIQINIAHEMLRVVKKQTGLILWYDFWLNPMNKQTRGIRKAEIRELFPDCDLIFRRITLAPPIARKIAPFSWIMAAALERLTLLNTHYLIMIKPRS